MRGSVAIGGAAVAVAALLIGGWFLLGNRHGGEADTGSAGTTGPAPTTKLGFESPSSDSPQSPGAYPTVPSAQVNDEVGPSPRTGNGGRQLFVPVTDLECISEEVRLLGEHGDRVEVEIRTVGKPPPPGATVPSDGSDGCMGYGSEAYAVIDLRDPLGDRRVVMHHEYN